MFWGLEIKKELRTFRSNSELMEDARPVAFKDSKVIRKVKDLAANRGVTRLETSLGKERKEIFTSRQDFSEISW